MYIFNSSLFWSFSLNFENKSFTPTNVSQQMHVQTQGFVFYPLPSLLSVHRVQCTVYSVHCKFHTEYSSLSRWQCTLIRTWSTEHIRPSQSSSARWSSFGPPSKINMFILMIIFETYYYMFRKRPELKTIFFLLRKKSHKLFVIISIETITI